MSFSKEYLYETISILTKINTDDIDDLIKRLSHVRDTGGRLFVLGVGGSAGSASHIVGDFRTITKIETYTPIDNASWLTAHINDHGWETSFAEWLRGSNLNDKDAILVLSVGGGSVEKNISTNIVKAIDFAKERGSTILGITGKDGGYTKLAADVCVVVPPIFPDKITSHSEGITMEILHLIISSPILKMSQTKWESVK